MTPLDIGIHIAGAICALLLGIAVLSMPKGTPRHKLIGRTWVVLMTIVALGSFRLHGISAEGGFSGIHLLSTFTLISMAYAIFMIRRGHRRRHFMAMIGCFVGLIVAGIFTLDSDRIIGNFFFGG